MSQPTEHQYIQLDEVEMGNALINGIRNLRTVTIGFAGDEVYRTLPSYRMMERVSPSLLNIAVLEEARIQTAALIESSLLAPLQEQTPMSSRQFIETGVGFVRDSYAASEETGTMAGVLLSGALGFLQVVVPKFADDYTAWQREQPLEADIDHPMLENHQWPRRPRAGATEAAPAQ